MSDSKKYDLTYLVKDLLPEEMVIKLRPLLTITEDLDYEVDRAAAVYGYYAVLSEKADTRYQRVKFNFEKWRAEAEYKESKDRSLAGAKAHTEAQMKAFIMSQPKYRSYQSHLIDVDEQKRVLKVIARALELKKDLVQTKCSNRRGEMKTPSGRS